MELVPKVEATSLKKVTVDAIKNFKNTHTHTHTHTHTNKHITLVIMISSSHNDKLIY